MTLPQEHLPIYNTDILGVFVRDLVFQILYDKSKANCLACKRFIEMTNAYVYQI